MIRTTEKDLLRQQIADLTEQLYLSYKNVVKLQEQVATLQKEKERIIQQKNPRHNQW